MRPSKASLKHSPGKRPSRSLSPRRPRTCGCCQAGPDGLSSRCSGRRAREPRGSRSERPPPAPSQLQEESKAQSQDMAVWRPALWARGREMAKGARRSEGRILEGVKEAVSHVKVAGPKPHSQLLPAFLASDTLCFNSLQPEYITGSCPPDVFVIRDFLSILLLLEGEKRADAYT